MKLDFIDHKISNFIGLQIKEKLEQDWKMIIDMLELLQENSKTMVKLINIKMCFLVIPAVRVLVQISDEFQKILLSIDTEWHSWYLGHTMEILQL